MTSIRLSFTICFSLASLATMPTTQWSNNEKGISMNVFVKTVCIIRTSERVHDVREQGERLEVVVDDYWLEDVQLKVAVAGAHSHSGVVAHHLRGDHGDCLALRGVHLARHDGGARLVLGERKLAKTTARAASKEAKGGEKKESVRERREIREEKK